MRTERRRAALAAWSLGLSLLIVAGSLLTGCPPKAEEDVDPSLYLGGMNAGRPGYWNKKSWVDLPPAKPGRTAWVSSVFVSGSDIYAGGSCEESADLIVAGYWHNKTWNKLSSPASAKEIFLTCLKVSGGVVYASGYYKESATGPVRPCYWGNNVLSLLALPDSTYKAAAASSILVKGTDVYVGGSAQDSSNVDRAGYWLNGTWKPLDPLKDGKTSYVSCLASSDEGVIYAGGSCVNEDGKEIGGYWENSVWTSLTPPAAAKESDIKSIALSGKDVYAAGSYKTAEGVKAASVWKNKTCTALPPIYTGKPCEVKSIVVAGGDVYAGGFGPNGAGIDVGGYWKNNGWIELPLVSGGSSRVHSIASQN